jgi:hypothetical protein
MELRFAYYILYQADDLARRHAHAREGHLDGGVAALQKCGEEHLLDPPKDVRLPDPDERDARQVQQTVGYKYSIMPLRTAIASTASA